MSLQGIVQPVVNLADARVVGGSRVSQSISAGIAPVALPAGAKAYERSGTLAAGASLTLDLAGGGLTDASGQAVTFTAIHLFFVSAAAANVHNLIVGAAAANPWPGPMVTDAGTKVLGPGDWIEQWSAAG
jgi:hypothetical protein